MPGWNGQRMAAEIEGDFVVFLIGMRINKPWKVWAWLPVFLAMPRMLRELVQRPDLGCLGTEAGFGTVIQYWRSFEHLDAYARSSDAAHLPAWVAFNRRTAGSSDVGVWHETYLVRAGEYEAVYHAMPPKGLGKAGRLVTAVGRRATAARRLGRTDAYPAEALPAGLDDPATLDS